MKKNILKYTLLISSLVIGTGINTSCTGDFESLNTSNVQVNPGDLPFAAQCAEPMYYCYPPQQNMFQFWTNLTIDLYGGYFMTPNGNFTNGDMGENRGHSGGMYENYYLHIFNNTRRIIKQCDASGEYGLAGAMRIVQAYGTLMTTDAYGPIPYTSVLESDAPSFYYFDSQQSLYQSMFNDLDKAIYDINNMGPGELEKLKSFDSWCDGDHQLWIKIANTLKLRMALRLSKREAEATAAGMNLKEIATNAATNTLAVTGKDILIRKGLENEMWLMFAWGDCGFNANLVTLMSGTKDPRQPLYMTMNTGEIEGATGTIAKNSQYLGIRFASGLPPKSNQWERFSGWIQGNAGSSYAMPLPIMKAAESYFLLAEAKLRWGIGSESVESLYEKGIRNSMQNELSYRGPYAGVENYDKDAIDNYINGTTTQVDFEDPVNPELNTPAVNTLSVKWVKLEDGATKEEQLQRIITQKYIALFPLSTEAWAEQRRTGYPKFFPAFVNESNGDVNTVEGVRRVIYGNQPYNTNAQGIAGGITILNQENTSKYDISGDKGGTHVWWDNADKDNF